MGHKDFTEILFENSENRTHCGIDLHFLLPSSLSKCVAQLHGQQTAAVLFSLKIVCFGDMFYATFTIYSPLAPGEGARETAACCVLICVHPSCWLHH